MCRPLLLLTLLVSAVLHAGEVRVVSQTVGTDELLVAVAEPAQIAALSHLANDSRYSGVVQEAARYPLLPLGGDAETILMHRPTLVLFADFSRTDLRVQVERAGIKTLVFDRYATMEDTYENLRRLGAAIGPAAESRAEEVIKDCEERIRHLRERIAGVIPVKVIAPSTYGIIPGRYTTFQDLCDHAGADNLGWSLGQLEGHATQPTEAMLAWPVDKLVVAGATLDAALAGLDEVPPYKFMPSVQERRAVVLEPYQLSCISHLRVRTYETLARELHPNRFR